MPTALPIPQKIIRKGNHPDGGKNPFSLEAPAEQHSSCVQTEVAHVAPSTVLKPNAAQSNCPQDVPNTGASKCKTKDKSKATQGIDPHGEAMGTSGPSASLSGAAAKP